MGNSPEKPLPLNEFVRLAKEAGDDTERRRPLWRDHAQTLDPGARAKKFQIMMRRPKS